jgi:hypothetical protein
VIQGPGRDKVHLAPEQGRQPVLDGDDAVADEVLGLELDEYIDVAVRAEVVPQHRAGERQAGDVVSSAEPGQPAAVDLKVVCRARVCQSSEARQEKWHAARGGRETSRGAQRPEGLALEQRTG